MANHTTGRHTTHQNLRNRSGWPFLSFILLCISMFLNLALAFLNARGVPMSAGSVTAIQALVTMAAVPAFVSIQARLKAMGYFALGFIIFSALVTNILNPFNPKTIYDSIIIPIYIALGMSASYVRPKWMNYVLLFVVVVVLIEIVLPSVYVGLFDPARYLSATREWIGNQKGNDATESGLYIGSMRNGGEKFSFVGHRVGGPFLEPLSLGYFAFIMSTYYATIYRGSSALKFIAITTCLILALASDSRIPTVLIIISTLFLILRLRLPVLLLWMAFPIVISSLYFLFLGQLSFLYGDTFSRLGVTFDTLANVDFGQLLVGIVPGGIGDSGIVYMLRCVGLFGMLVSIWYYSGAFAYKRGANIAFFVVIALYLSITLMFGTAVLSIKTASLLGYLVGLASTLNRSAARRDAGNNRTEVDEEGPRPAIA